MQEREDEIEALSAIFGDEFHLVDDQNLEVSITLDAKELKLRCFLPENYPDASAEPNIEGSWLNDPSKAALRSQLEIIAEHDVGSVIVFKWVDWLRESSLDFLSRNELLDLQPGPPSAGAGDITILQENTTLESNIDFSNGPPLSTTHDENALNLPEWIQETQSFQTWASWSVFDQHNGMRCGVWGELDGK